MKAQPIEKINNLIKKLSNWENNFTPIQVNIVNMLREGKTYEEVAKATDKTVAIVRKIVWGGAYGKNGVYKKMIALSK
jgi:uncharacterized protein YerC